MCSAHGAVLTMSPRCPTPGQDASSSSTSEHSASNSQEAAVTTQVSTAAGSSGGAAAATISSGGAPVQARTHHLLPQERARSKHTVRCALCKAAAPHPNTALIMTLPHCTRRRPAWRHSQQLQRVPRRAQRPQRQRLLRPVQLRCIRARPSSRGGRARSHLRRSPLSARRSLSLHAALPPRRRME